MKEFESDSNVKTEISVKQKKQVEHELIGKIIPHDGHTIWQINQETLQIEKAKFSNATYHLNGENKKEILIKEGFAYISALNQKNALKKYNKRSNGSKEIEKKPMSLYKLSIRKK